MTEDKKSTPVVEPRRSRVPLPVFQGIPDDAETAAAAPVVRAVAAMPGPVFTSPQS
ncbi:hypothetical protein [Actinokineospora sp.]|uniref:hypothetical protein n=1 Tax=Actinokineospora sp. TaxID=1872133 RepID=UPI004037BF5C